MSADWKSSVNIAEQGLTPAAYSCRLPNQQSRLPEKNATLTRKRPMRPGERRRGLSATPYYTLPYPLH